MTLLVSSFHIRWEIGRRQVPVLVRLSPVRSLLVI